MTGPFPNIGETENHTSFSWLRLPYSGSTAIAKVLNTGSRTMLLHHTGEGQRLIPGLAGRGRWRADMFVDYESIRAVWLDKGTMRSMKSWAA